MLKILILFLCIIISLSFVSAIVPGDCLAIGGSISVDGSSCVHTFIGNGSFYVGNSINITILVLGGGGAGGSSDGAGGGGSSGRGGTGLVIIRYLYTDIITDTCTYSGSGNWFVKMSDNCIITSNVDLSGNILTLNGTGSFTCSSKIQYNDLFMTPGVFNGGFQLLKKTGCMMLGKP